MSACLFKKTPLFHSTLEILKNSQYPYKDGLNLPEVYDIASHISLHLATYCQKKEQMNFVPSEKPYYLYYFFLKEDY